MKKNKFLFENRWMNMLQLAYGFLLAGFSALGMLFGKKMKIHPGTSRLFEIFDTIAHTAPKQFWKFPTALTLARAPGLLFRFLFRSPHDFQKIGKK